MSAVGIAAGASVLKGRSLAPVILKTLPIRTEKEKEREKEKVQYILQLSTDSITVESEKPGDFTVTVWKKVGTQPPQGAPEAEIRLTPPTGAGLIVNPSVGQGQMSVQV